MWNVKNEVFVLNVALSAFEYTFIIVLSASTDVMKSSQKLSIIYRACFLKKLFVPLFHWFECLIPNFSVEVRAEGLLRAGQL